MADRPHGRPTLEEAWELLPDTLKPSTPCRATNRQGQPCGRHAIPGGTVCKFHGGGAPQVREAARRRIEMLVPMALRYQEDLLNDEAAPHAAKVRTAIDVLDRAGLKAVDVSVQVSSEQANEALDEAIATALQARGIEVAGPPPHTEPHTDEA